MTKKEQEIQSSPVILDKDQDRIQEEFNKLFDSDFDIEKAAFSLLKVYKSQIAERKKQRTYKGKNNGKKDKSSVEGSN